MPQLIPWRSTEDNLGKKKASSLGEGKDSLQKTPGGQSALQKPHPVHKNPIFFPNFIFSQVFLLVTVAKLGPPSSTTPSKRIFQRRLKETPLKSQPKSLASRALPFQLTNTPRTRDVRTALPRH